MKRKLIKLQRVYDSKTDDDTYRVLVDRLWPRGIKKIDLAIDEWNKSIPPSTTLRKWFNHEEKHYAEFTTLYREELQQQESELERLREIAKTETITLLFGAKDPKINHAVVLRDVLLGK